MGRDLMEWVEVYDYVASFKGGDPVGRIRRHELSNIGITTFGDQNRMSVSQTQLMALQIQPSWEPHPWE